MWNGRAHRWKTGGAEYPLVDFSPIVRMVRRTNRRYDLFWPDRMIWRGSNPPGTPHGRGSALPAVLSVPGILREHREARSFSWTSGEAKSGAHRPGIGFIDISCGVGHPAKRLVILPKGWSPCRKVSPGLLPCRGKLGSMVGTAVLPVCGRQEN